MVPERPYSIISLLLLKDKVLGEVVRQANFIIWRWEGTVPSLLLKLAN